MSRYLLTIIGTIVAVSLVAVISRGFDSPATAGIPIPPPGTDELEINGKVHIDLTLCCDSSENVDLEGSLAVERGADEGGTVPIEIVSLSLTGTSSLLGPNTPVEVSLNPSGGPATGYIIPAKGFAQMVIPFMDVNIGTFGHYLNKDVVLTSENVPGIPFTNADFASEEKQHPIIDNEAPNPKEGLRGYVNQLLIDIKKPPDATPTPDEKTYEIIVVKEDADTEQGLEDWEINIYAGPDCNGTPFDNGFTDEFGILTFDGLEAGTYSVEEKPQAGWNPVTDECQNVEVPAGSGLGGLPDCPIQPNLDHPDPGCDEFDSLASVGVNLTNPSEQSFDCDLSGPTQIRRNPLIQIGDFDSIPTEITAMELTGQCEPGGVEITVSESSTEASTGQITEQENEVEDELEFKANSYFDVFFEVETPLGTFHNQEALRMECKIQAIPPSGCFYEPDVGTITLYDDEKKEVGVLKHARHIPIGPKNNLVIFQNERKDVTPTDTPSTGPTATPTPSATPTDTVEPTKTPQPQRTRHATLRCLRASAGQKVTGSVTVTEKKDDKPPEVVYSATCNSNTNPVVRATYSISAGATKNVAMSVTVDSQSDDCDFPGYAATQRVSVRCTVGPAGLAGAGDEGLYLVDSESEAGDGDANKNESVDSIDAALILQFVAGLTDAWPNSDANGDGQMNAVDAALVLQFTAGLIPALPV